MPTAIERIAKKAQNIAAALGPDATHRMNQRLERAGREEKNAIKALLHFSWHSLKGTTSESRSDIRKAIASYLAGGGTIEGAQQFREMLKGMAPDRLKDLTQKMCLPNADHAKLIAQSFPQSSEANLRPLSAALSGLPPVPDDANQWVHGRTEHAHAIFRDSTGTARVHTRADLIQAFKRGCEERGCDPGMVSRLDGSLQEAGYDTLIKMSREIQDPTKSPAQAIVRVLIPVTERSREDFATVTQLLANLPPDLAKAGQTLLADPVVTLSTDEHGVVRVANVDSKLLPGIPIPQANRELNADKIQGMKRKFEDVAQMNYGRVGVPLDFMRHARESGGSMTEAFASYRPDGGKLMETSGSGDCLTATGLFIEQLRKEGIQAYASGSLVMGLTNQQVGGHKREVDDSPEQSEGVTHLDVVVPYTTQAGEERAMVFHMGIGNKPENVRDYALSDLTDPNAPFSLRLKPDGTGLDVAKFQKSSLGYLTNIQFTNGAPGTDGNQQIGGIDLTRGSLYMTTAASQAYTGPRLKDQVGARTLAFNFRDAMAHSDDKVILATSKGDIEVTKLEALAVFAEGMRRQFNLPKDFVANVMHLAANEQQYKQAVLWSSVQELHQVDRSQDIRQTQRLVPEINPEEVAPDLKPKEQRVEPELRIEGDDVPKVEIEESAIDLLVDENLSVAERLDQEKQSLPGTKVDERTRRNTVGSIVQSDPPEEGIEKPKIVRRNTLSK